MIGIIGAMQSEVEGLKKIMEQAEIKVISSVEFVKGKISGIDVVVAQAGVGNPLNETLKVYNLSTYCFYEL